MRLLCLWALTTAISCHAVLAQGQMRKIKPQPWTILPAGEPGGMITAETSEAALRKIYGIANVVPYDVEQGEGETESGTRVFPNDPLRRIDIVWKNNETKKQPKDVQIYGKRSLWKTIGNITLGTTLKQLEQQNGRSFTLAGFGWDYSGTVVSWDAGNLASALTSSGRVLIRLEATDNAHEEIYNSVLGDRDYSSGIAAMQELNPRIYQIVWLFP